MTLAGNRLQVPPRLHYFCDLKPKELEIFNFRAFTVAEAG